MIQKNIFLTAPLVIFWITIFLYRCWDVFAKRYGHGGEIYYGWTLYALAVLHFLVGIFSIAEYFLSSNSYNWVVGLCSFFIFVLGQLIRNSAIRALGKFHSPQIEIKPNHKLINSFPYSFIRNPYYLGVVLEVGSSSLIFNAYFTFIFYLLTYLPMLILRVFLEEKVLTSHFGSEYQKYRTNVSALGFYKKSRTNA
jgi:protein-S-isoprenylcysteine O-methyltransferase Ste14